MVNYQKKIRLGKSIDFVNKSLIKSGNCVLETKKNYLFLPENIIPKNSLKVSNSIL